MQKAALYEGIASDRKDTFTIINAAMEELKPWLDIQMYFKLKDIKDNTRPNANWGK